MCPFDLKFRKITNTSKMSNKVPPDYFIYPEYRLFPINPVIWVLLPIVAFCPELLSDYLSVQIFGYILKVQVNTYKNFN